MKLKLINKPAKQNRGMNIPLGGYLCGPVFDLFCSSNLAVHVFCSATISLRIVCRAALLSSVVFSGILQKNDPCSKMKLAPANRSFSLESIKLRLANIISISFIASGLFNMMFSPVKNYWVFILLFALIHKSVIYVKKLTTRFDFTNRRSCHA
jgi:uncharacterized membrane protein